MLIDDDENPRLCDFGLSKVLEDVPSGLTTTKTSNYTLRYAAPEVNNGAPHSLASDVWAWGCLLLFVRMPPSTLRLLRLTFGSRS